MPKPSLLEPHLRALYALPQRPSAAQIAAAAELLAAYAVDARKRYPSMAIAATLRAHRVEAKLSPTVVQALAARAAELLPPPPEPVEVPREHVPTRAAAKIVGEDPDELHARMAEPAQRRLYGYPYWDGRDFRFPLLALRAQTRAAYLAGLPEQEPAAIAATLPPWCSAERPAARAAAGGAD